MKLRWALHALRIAEAAAATSRDPFTKVGAVVMDREYSVLSVGFNGPAPGARVDLCDREGRRPFVLHAEMNALARTLRRDTAGGFMVVTHHPCNTCVLIAAAHGVREIAWRDELRWSDVYDRDAIQGTARTSGIRLSHIDKESTGEDE
jgi:deoxycytidylate deaminase